MNKDIDRQTLEYFLTDIEDEKTDVGQFEREKWLRENPQQQEQLRELDEQWSDVEALAPWAAEEIGRLENSLGLTRASGVDSAFVNRFLHYLKWLCVPMSAIALLLIVVFSVIQQDSRLYYETVKGEQRKLVLADGSRVSLNSGSEIEVTFTEQARNIRLIKGEGLFEVVHEERRPFIVRARENQVVAIGTVFNVRFDREDVEVTVLEGRVAVVPEQDMPPVGISTPTTQEMEVMHTNFDLSGGVLLGLDEQVRVSQLGVIDEPAEVRADDVAAWNRGMMIFDGVSLREVAREMSRYIEGDIQVDDAVASQLVTGGIKISDRETMLGLLLEVVPIQLVNKNSMLTILTEDTNSIN